MNEFNPRYGSVYINKLTLINRAEPERSIEISFPSEADTVFKSLESIGVNEAYASAFGGYLYRGEKYTIPFQSLKELDDFLTAYEQAVENDTQKADKINAVLEDERVSGTDEAIYLIEHSDEFNFYPEIQDVTELGRRMFSLRFGDEVIDEAEYYIDRETYGQDYINFHDYGCKFVSGGFIERTEEYRSYESVKELEESEEIEL